MKKTFIQSPVWICAAFTAATLISCVIQLAAGTQEDSNAHILVRCAIIVFAVAAIQVVRSMPALKADGPDGRRRLQQALRIVVPWCVTVSFALVCVWLVGLTAELHPDAYRDVFLNVTAAFILVTAATLAVGMMLKRWRKARGQNSPQIYGGRAVRVKTVRQAKKEMP